MWHIRNDTRKFPEFSEKLSHSCAIIMMAIAVGKVAKLILFFSIIRIETKTAFIIIAVNTREMFIIFSYLLLYMRIETLQ